MWRSVQVLAVIPKKGENQIRIAIPGGCSGTFLRLFLVGDSRPGVLRLAVVA